MRPLRSVAVVDCFGYISGDFKRFLTCKLGVGRCLVTTAVVEVFLFNT